MVPSCPISFGTILHRNEAKKVTLATDRVDSQSVARRKNKKKGSSARTSKYPKLAEVGQHLRHFALGRHSRLYKAVVGILYPTLAFGEREGVRDPRATACEASRCRQGKGESHPRVSLTRRTVELHDPEGFAVQVLCSVHSWQGMHGTDSARGKNRSYGRSQDILTLSKTRDMWY